MAKLGIKLFNRIFITDVLKGNGTATGAMGFDIRSANYIFLMQVL